MDLPQSKDHEVSPQAPPKKKSKKSDANKGILIAENPHSPARDNVTFALTCFLPFTRIF
jgi:hypothetical protein